MNDILSKIGAFFGSINFGDFFTQISHVVTIGLGVGTALGLVDQHTGTTVGTAIGSAVGEFAQTIPQTVNSVNQTIHAIGDLIAAIGTIGLLFHNKS